MGFFMRFRQWFARMMYGRYGARGFDQLNKMLMYSSLILLLLGRLIPVLYFIGLAEFIYMYFRIFSKNIYKREYENDKYLRAKDKIRCFFSKLFNRSGDDGRFSSRCNSYSGNTYTLTYKIFKCPKCKQKLRVPRGKGRIQISCKRCGNEFIKRT